MSSDIGAHVHMIQTQVTQTTFPQRPLNNAASKFIHKGTDSIIFSHIKPGSNQI